MSIYKQNTIFEKVLNLSADVLKENFYFVKYVNLKLILMKNQTLNISSN